MKTKMLATSVIEEPWGIKIKLVKGLLDLIVLKFLEIRPMHGYGLIKGIRKNFGIYFGPSTIYRLLSHFEKSGCVKSHWTISNNKPKKMFSLTAKGKALLNFNQDMLNDVSRTLQLSQNMPTGYSRHGNIVEIETINKIPLAHSKVR